GAPPPRAGPRGLGGVLDPHLRAGARRRVRGLRGAPCDSRAGAGAATDPRRRCAGIAPGASARRQCGRGLSVDTAAARIGGRMPDRPLISVLVPVYNEAGTVRTLLERVMAVPLRKEIIVVDDCSTDGTREVLTDFQASARDTAENRFVFAFHERNM